MQPIGDKEKIQIASWYALWQAGAVIGLGAALLAMGYTQPAWLGDRIGPGLFAQYLAKGTLVLGGVMALLAVWRPAWTEGFPSSRHGLVCGAAILLGVAVFAALARDLGLVICCAMAAGLTGWAAGERSLFGLLRAAATGAIAAAAIGLTLLPPAAPIWP